MNPVIARHAIYLPIQRALGGDLKVALRFHADIERQPESELEKYQEGALKELLDHVFSNVPFYREIVRKQPDLRTKDPFDILARLPIVSKADIREDISLFRDSKYTPFWRSTSGSTGLPFRFCKDRPSLLQMDAAMHAVYSWYGIEIGDRQARIWGRALRPRQRMAQGVKDLLLNRRRLSAFGITRETSRTFFSALERFRPAFIYCYPNAAVLFARYLNDMSLNGRALSLKAIICTSEPLLENHRSFLTDAFGCPVISEYGNSENGILAFECERGQMHALCGNVILEFLNNGKPASPGCLAEIAVTELHSRSIPFIRYRTGDLGAPRAERCTCGRPLPLVQLSCGRDHSFILRPDGTRVHAALLAYILKQGILQFRVIQLNLRELIVEFVPDHTYTDGLERIFRKRLHKYFGKEFFIRFRKVAHIPPEKNGKVLYFVSQIGTQL
ncbi:MAG: phenylacetate--CoA ligase family protein [Candidatus Abyssobacteria bacterium SURF_5]|uniref:Phenylacetate--CoA ligase family protein n=1 Tax=Abyssobacteria bacterium (strain SURF_5) TaxID=2093360 RepID=A0A3A4NRJ6_ABYX5|nr:MAG: phenylacetate--CoA ligase family protein [Candidatus Abyssubacteria bacterium SURF_5]